MTTRVVKLSMVQLVEDQKRLGVAFVPALRRGFMAGGLRAVGVLQQATRMAGPAGISGKGTGGAVNYGVYLRSWKSHAESDGVRVFNDAPYAGVIEVGRRAGARMPPRAAIARWAQRRLGLSESEAARAAFVIARSIARWGLVGRNVMGGAMKDIRRGMIEEIRREMDTALAGGR